MFFSESLLSEGDRWTPFCVQECYMSAMNDFVNGEWHVNAEVTGSGLGKPITGTDEYDLRGTFREYNLDFSIINN